MQPPSEKSEFESPAWHGNVLQETEQRYEAGLERPVDWATAKWELRARRYSAPDQERHDHP
jgi:Putative addiction module component.